MGWNAGTGHCRRNNYSLNRVSSPVFLPPDSYSTGRPAACSHGIFLRGGIPVDGVGPVDDNEKMVIEER